MIQVILFNINGAPARKYGVTGQVLMLPEVPKVGTLIMCNYLRVFAVKKIVIDATNKDGTGRYLVGVSLTGDDDQFIYQNVAKLLKKEGGNHA